jgi:virginiamycin B lyase
MRPARVIVFLNAVSLGHFRRENIRRSSRFILASALTLLGLPALSQPFGPPVNLPDGPGKKHVEAACVACHQLNTVAGTAGYTQEGWRYLIAHMIDLPEPTVETIASYLAAHFPETSDRRPTLVPGDAVVTFKEWVVPTLGQRPRDPFQLEDGTIWWAGMYASLIGRLDPATGEMQEYKLEEGARPHSIVADASGNIWYTRDGTLWFTLQNSNMLGHLVWATGEIELIAMPTARTRPYGIKQDADGMLWIAYNGSNKIPSGVGIIRHMRVTPDGNLAIHQSSTNTVGLALIGGEGS